MKVFVYVEAYTPVDDYADIVQTKVFTNIHEACAFLKKTADVYRNYEEDAGKWFTTSENETHCHMIYDGDKDEVVMSVEMHEI